MNTNDTIFQGALAKLLDEIFDGPPGSEAFLLNPGDPGLLRQLDAINASAASMRPMPGKTTIASHVAHVSYGLSLLNRWSDGEVNPWASADWEASWKRSTVDEDQWQILRAGLLRQSEAWRKHAGQRTDWDGLSAAGALASAAHTAYHFGSIRQILAALDKSQNEEEKTAKVETMLPIEDQPKNTALQEREGYSKGSPQPSTAAAAAVEAIGPGALPAQKESRTSGEFTSSEIETLFALVSRAGGVDALIRWLQLHPDLTRTISSEPGKPTGFP